jgi:hypothetical protein
VTHVCHNCGTVVTYDFARVFGNNDQQVYGCPTCTSFRELMEGRGARPDG